MKEDEPMPADYRTVRLMKNRLYPTYQLHAVMAARKTTPEDGLKIGVLTILDSVSYTHLTLPTICSV